MEPGPQQWYRFYRDTTQTTYRRTKDKRTKLRLAREATAMFWASAFEPVWTFRNAASSDAELSLAWAEHERRRYADAVVMIESFEHLFREGMTTQVATDVYWAIASVETVHNLISRGWSMQQFAEWLTDSMDRLLLVR